MMAAPEKMQALGELRRDEPMSKTCRLSCANSTRRRQYSGWASAATCS
jgi:hypothetical protein